MLRLTTLARLTKSFACLDEIVDAALSLVLKGSECALVVGKQNSGDDFIGRLFPQQISVIPRHSPSLILIAAPVSSKEPML